MAFHRVRKCENLAGSLQLRILRGSRDRGIATRGHTRISALYMSRTDASVYTSYMALPVLPFFREDGEHRQRHKSVHRFKNEVYKGIQQ